MEAVDRNDEYEQQAAGGQHQAKGSQVYEYDSMYDKIENFEETYDKMYS